MEDALIAAEGDLHAAMEMLSVQASAKSSKKSKKSKSKTDDAFLSAEQKRRLGVLEAEIAARKAEAKKIRREAKARQKEKPKIVRRQPAAKKQRDTTLDYMVTAVVPWEVKREGEEYGIRHLYLTKFILQFPADKKVLKPEDYDADFDFVYQRVKEVNAVVGLNLDNYLVVGNGMSIPNLATGVQKVNVADGTRFKFFPDNEDPDMVNLGVSPVPDQYRDITQKTLIVEDSVDLAEPEWYRNPYGRGVKPYGAGYHGEWPRKMMVVVVPYTIMAEKKYMDADIY